ncbi:GrpB family protein [Paenibacillus qinlingensis]|uniref:GrpB-like predicted nucleotidyltransferase (UPF0157 family) n=1 Tax=Paenibacillus qinlingensis TaxID=1837343 RepID=A0ABU1NT60_9BACL|nr:GrpB family protein [Paenibacillus qinlingensis]MDR6550172.1 GrpB-like predicted nucleotidyltransferase (UPF0157 family) [Paenibacillus qinlingensis]
MEEQWRIAAYEPEWKDIFNDVASTLRQSLGAYASRIDHVGSTSVIGLDAKPIIDIQISVLDLDDTRSYKHKIENVGFVFREDNQDKSKKYFREIAGTRRTHIHVRQVGSFSEQLTLLFRDYLREHPEDCVRYALEKHRLFALYQHERTKYVEGKGPVVWDIIQKAHLWSQEVGWSPSVTDM